jgi:hypothetical protein
MSFSFSAGGTKEQTLHSLGELHHDHDSHSKTTADLVTSMVTAGPSESDGADGQVYDAIYQVSAYGHSSAGHDTPSLSVSVSSSLRLRETPAEVEVDVVVEEDDPAGE